MKYQVFNNSEKLKPLINHHTTDHTKITQDRIPQESAKTDQVSENTADAMASRYNSVMNAKR